MGLNPLTDDVAIKTDANAILQSVKHLLNTNFYERPFRPDVGTNIRKILFEPVDHITTELLKNGIFETLTNWEPRINVQDVIVTDMPDSNSYDIRIIYSMLLEDTPKEISVTLRRLR